MAGFDPRISVVGSDCSTNCAPANHCPNRSPCLKLFLLMITLGEWLMATTSLSLFSNADRVMGEHWKEFFTIFYFYWDSIWNINFSKEALPKLFRYWTFKRFKFTSLFSWMVGEQKTINKWYFIGRLAVILYHKINADPSYRKQMWFIQMVNTCKFID